MALSGYILQIGLLYFISDSILIQFHVFEFVSAILVLLCDYVLLGLGIVRIPLGMAVYAYFSLVTFVSVVGLDVVIKFANHVVF